MSYYIVQADVVKKRYRGMKLFREEADALGFAFQVMNYQNNTGWFLGWQCQKLRRKFNELYSWCRVNHGKTDHQDSVIIFCVEEYQWFHSVHFAVRPMRTLGLAR